MNTEGQSTIELIVVLPIIIAFWTAIVWFARIFIISIVLMHTARHGVFWLAYHDDPNMDPQQERQLVLNECMDFFHQQAPSIDMSQVHLSIDPGDQWQPFGPKNLLDIIGAFELATNFKKTIKNAAGLITFNPATVEVVYDLPSPPLLRAIPGFPTTIHLRGYSACYR